jgi:hypothetical protein
MTNAYQSAGVVQVGPAHRWIQSYKFFFFCLIDSECWVDFAERYMDIDESDA